MASLPAVSRARTHAFATGCNELIFNPLIDWWRLGPITKQLRIFIWSNAPVHYKISMMACTCYYCCELSKRLLTPWPYSDMFSYCASICPNSSSDYSDECHRRSGWVFSAVCPELLPAWLEHQGKVVVTLSKTLPLTPMRDRSTAITCTVSRFGLHARSCSPARETSASHC